MAANPSYYQTSGSVTSQVQHQEHLFHLYMFQQMGNNEFNIVPSKGGLPHHFGCTNVTDWDIRDAPDNRAAVVARLQGVGIAARKSTESWYGSFIVVFTDQRFKGSTLSVQGPLGPGTLGDEGHWAVVGGTGEFVYAQGVCSYKRIQTISGGLISELRIRVMCLTIPMAKPVKKIGPWGGNGGTPYEIQGAELPQRLESLTVTVYANSNFIQTTAFSYTDQSGQKRSVKLVHGMVMLESPSNRCVNFNSYTTIQFGPSETVKEIYGSTGNNYDGVHTVVTSLTIVTNVNTYGPYGKQSAGNTPFRIAAPDNHNIVEFYGRVGDVVDQIGAYVSPN